jgi:pyridoxine 5-phosphate synthase
LFIEPEEKIIKLAKELNADAVELHTGRYSLCKVGTKDFYIELEKIKKTVKFAIKENLIVNAGHGLDYNNVKPIAEIKNINTLNIGFSIVSRAVFVGLENAVKEMLYLIRR